MITELLAWPLSHPVLTGAIVVAFFVVASGDASRIARLLAACGVRFPRIIGGRNAR